VLQKRSNADIKFKRNEFAVLEYLSGRFVLESKARATIKCAEAGR
jgi:hypothetical protein